MDTPASHKTVDKKHVAGAVGDDFEQRLHRGLSRISYRQDGLEREGSDTTGYPPVWRQYAILLTLNLAMFVDVISTSALNVILPQVARDLDLAGGDISWIFLLSAGRLADLTNAVWVFIVGIGMVGVFAIIVSFLSSGIVFLVVRAIQGIAAACTIPSSYNITVRTFPEGKARNRAIAILGLVGSVSFSIGVIIGGVMETASWRWLFRMIGILSGVTAILALLVVPKTTTHPTSTLREIVVKMDLLGLFLSVGAIILFVLALTSGPEYGWNDPRFYVPLPLSVAMIVGFFVWEAKGRDEGNAMLPAVIWETPTVKPLAILVLSPFVFWSTGSYGFPTFWQEALGRSSVESALRLLPIGIAALVSSVIIQVWPKILSWRRWPVYANMAVVAAMEILYVYSGGGIGVRYWSMLVPPMVVASALCQFTFLAINVLIITSVPPQRAGVAGALCTVQMQLGNVIGIAVQSACLQRTHGPILVWRNYARSYWAIFAWIMASAVGTALFSYLDLRKARRSSSSELTATKAEIVHLA